MRILFSTVANAGHFLPLVPLARAAMRAGHTVAFASKPSYLPTIEQQGFAAFPAGYTYPAGYAGPEGVFKYFAGSRAVPLLELEEWLQLHVYIPFRSAIVAVDLLDLCFRWSPDVIVRDAMEYGGCIAAEVLGIPHASVRTAAINSSYTRRYRLAVPLAALRERHGLPPDPDVAMPFRYLHLAGEPADFLTHGDIPAPTRHLLRPLVFEPIGEGLPAWVQELPDRPTVYATLGTTASGIAVGRGFLPVLLEALRDEPINLILTVGHTNDPAAFGPQPANIHIERYIPQSLLLPYCDVSVNQGGFGTMMGAVAAGVPQVMIPFSADQPANAECGERLGVGVIVREADRNAEGVRTAVRRTLGEPSHRAKAVQVRAEVAARPGPEHAMALLEQLATEKRPLLTS